ncbi:transposase [Halobacteroides halobius DSM 5150]|uniref:Transposase n=1 Tax=Halobacteroides halobius (strain ATCC 35273 / DSM 5150 / MD-1) TaxID=748449 RepID=L0KBY6_HALHC|nr:IS110 family transposase [Halobacteroides halobius]AGB40333.1 transposase [Halobacteroides halobius DSM 5150]AGB41142.1 transposase [Halobacteroides halobius DSM 5150]AGB41463.1 transposase [Halobacteroides halobius DSM 5150]AGB41874.1 transposase [Halobacteroides halobius DSM 5150]
MNYTQNKKIKQIKSTTLVIGIDIAKKQHVARAQNYRGIEYDKPLKFKNTQNGLERLLNWIKKVKIENEKEEVVIGMEPTGHYWLNIAQFITEEEIKLVLVNPHHVKKSKELDDNNPTKNDVKDAKVIAQLVKDGRFSEPNIPEGIYAEMRVAMTHKEKLTQDLTRVKNRVMRWLDIYFPEFNEVFKDWTGKAALATLKYFPYPDQIAKMEAEEIVAKWREEGIKRGVGIKRAKKLKKAAVRSIGVTEGFKMGKEEISYHIKQYCFINEELEVLMEKVEKLLEKIPGVEKMLTVDGVGVKTIAGFISEVGDLWDYEHPKQIISLAGLNLKENSSGKHKGETKITKRGRPKLRALLYRVAMPLVAQNDEFRQLHKYYTTRRENPLKKKQSLIVLCCKLIRVLFTLGRKQVEYDGKKMLNDIKRPNVKNAA